MNHRLPPQLLKHLSESNVLLFLGPEVTGNEGSNQTLRWVRAIETAMRLGVSLRESEELERFLERTSPAPLAQAARLQLGQEAYLQLTDVLKTPEDLLPSPIIYALRGLNIQRWFTTNTNTLLERAFEPLAEGDPSLDIHYALPGESAPYLNDGNHSLCKLFGDHSQPEALVLGTDDFETYWRRRPAFAQALKTQLADKFPLFVGYTLDDPAFLRIYSLIGPALAKNNRRGFALLNNIGSFDTQWWSRRSLRLIPLEGPESLEPTIRSMIQGLNQQASPGTPAESERSPQAQSLDGAPKSPTHAILEAQLKWAMDSWLIHPLLGPLDLDNHYVSRRLDPEIADGHSREDCLEILMSDEAETAHREIMDPQGLTIQTLIGKGGRLLITGPSGSGKTTLLLSLLQRYAKSALEDGSPTMAFYLPLSYLTPVEWDPEPDLIGRLTAHLIRLVNHLTPDDLRQVIEQALEEDRAILLLDGWDDVPPEHVPALRAVLERLRRAYRDANIILTSRSPIGVEGPPPGFPVYGLKPLTEGEVGQLITRRIGTNAAPILMAALAGGSAHALDETPFNLALACDHFTHTGSLPVDLNSLLNDALYRQHRVGSTHQKSILAVEALEALERVATEALGDKNSALTATRVQEILSASLREQGLEEPDDMGRRLLDTLRQGSGILIGPNIQGSFTFRHQQFQEYLAACHLKGSRGRDPSKGHGKDPNWQGVWPFLAAQQTDSTSLLRALEKAKASDGLISGVAQASASYKLKWILGKVTDDHGEEELASILEAFNGQLSSTEELDLYESILVWDREHFETDGNRINARLVWSAIVGLETLIYQEGSAARSAALTLASWQTTRPEDNKGPWPQEAVRVESGPSLYSEEGRELETRFINLPGFFIGLTPVTTKLWRTFFPNHTPANTPEQFLQGDHPAVGISYFQASVCAAWYGARLPSEEEWDKAAAWCSDSERRRTYPWGDSWDPTCCNTLETWKGTTGSTTPVDQFGESGVSAYGCMDMAGNVLEWLATGRDANERQILRGGSWMATASFARCGGRLALKGDIKKTGIGFRLAFDQSTD